MRYLTAFIGGLLIFIGVFVLTAIIVALLPPACRPWIAVGDVGTNNPIGVVLAGLAATASFRATLIRARKKDEKRQSA